MNLNDVMYDLCHDTSLNRLINSCGESRNRNIIEYILNKYTDLCQFPTIINDIKQSLIESGKSYEKAIDLIYEANKTMNCKDFSEALNLWNRSLQLLPHTHESFVEDFRAILTGRGVCFEKLKRTEELKRNNQLMNSLKVPNNPSGIMELIQKESQPNMNFLSPSLEPHLYRNQHSRQYKLGLRVKRSIKKNKLLIREKPIVIVRQLSNNHCLNCDAKVTEAFYPCFLCRDVRYCNVFCAEEGFLFHKYECGMLSALYEHKLILLLNVLRFYARINENPLTEFDPGFNYLFHFQQNFCQSLVTNDLCLNSLRQSLIQTEKPKTVYFRPKLFGNIFRAIIFERIYSMGIERAKFGTLERRKNKPEVLFQKYDFKEPEELANIDRTKETLEKISKLNLLEKIYDDIDKFDDCPFIDSNSFPWADEESLIKNRGSRNQDKDSGAKVSYVPVICSGLAAQNIGQNYSTVWNHENGYLCVRANKDMYPGVVISIINRLNKFKSQKLHKIIEHLRKDAMIESTCVDENTNVTTD